MKKYLVHVYSSKFHGSYYKAFATKEEANIAICLWLQCIDNVVCKTKEVLETLHELYDDELTFEEYYQAETPHGEGFYRLSNGQGQPDTFIGPLGKNSYKLGKFHFRIIEVTECRYRGQVAYQNSTNPAVDYLDHLDPNYAWVALSKYFA